MNKWELKYKYLNDFIEAMDKYGKSINSDKESDDYKRETFNWASLSAYNFKKQWEEINGALADE